MLEWKAWVEGSNPQFIVSSTPESAALEHAKEWDKAHDHWLSTSRDGNELWVHVEVEGENRRYRVAGKTEPTYWIVEEQ